MKALFILSCTAVFIFSSCGSGEKPTTANTESSSKEQPAQATGSAEFTINAVGNNMADMGYDTKEIKVKSGAKVKVNLTNTATDAAMIHNIVFVKQGSEKDVAMEGMNFAQKNYCNAGNANIIAGSALAKPGETVTVEFVAPAPGTYTYICTFPGHWMKMQGVLIVE